MSDHEPRMFDYARTHAVQGTLQRVVPVDGGGGAAGAAAVSDGVVPG